ncbi:hypothetical protein [Actinomadura harenae]|uniref:Uncharacterized protein n=1 Tax=Actinomadura harenae TaxID=2483351 RepID=A0A3M2M1J7_9ACTN|nr:hypothetical protein [Actinomadura harenae]RMI43312.1 hypothetical protein EBO15_16665 [Actinomadura harenae]
MAARLIVSAGDTRPLRVPLVDPAAHRPLSRLLIASLTAAIAGGKPLHELNPAFRATVTALHDLYVTV